MASTIPTGEGLWPSPCVSCSSPWTRAQDTHLPAPFLLGTMLLFPFSHVFLILKILPLPSLCLMQLLQAVGAFSP